MDKCCAYLSRRDRTKVARYEVPGKAFIDEPSRRVRSDGLGFRDLQFGKREHGWTRRKSALKRRTPPSGLPIIPFPTGRDLFRGYQALRTWLPSFSPFGTTKRQYLSTFSKPHHTRAQYRERLAEAYASYSSELGGARRTAEPRARATNATTPRMRRKETAARREMRGWSDR